MVTLFYHSAWAPPIIHFSVAGGPWQDRPLARTARFFWHTIEIEAAPVSFVFTDGRKHWDNPSPHCSSTFQHNYHIRSPGRYAIYHGDVLPIAPPAQRVLLITDLDGTLVLQGSAEGEAASARFVRLWLQKHYFNGSVLVYSSGRCLEEFLELKKSTTELLDPDLYIGEVGGDAFSMRSDSGEYEVRADYQAAFPATHWDTAIVSYTLDTHFSWLIFPSAHGNCRLSTYRVARIEDLTRHEAALRAFISESGNWPSRDKEIHCLLHVSGCGSHRYLDFTADHGGKRAGVEFCRREFGFGPEETLVAGDSGNDLGMFKGPEKGVIPANRQEEMDRWVQKKDRGPHKYVSQQKFADAIIEALGRF